MLISRHGGSATISVDGFDDVTGLLCKTLVSYNILNFWLVGYSLGGRVAMMAACRELAGFVELLSKAGIPDCKMLNNARNVSVPIANGAAFSYRTVNGGICRLVSTACFASLNDDQRRELVALRSNNNGATLAAMLEATSRRPARFTC